MVVQGVMRAIVTNLPRRHPAGCYYLEDGVGRVNEVLVRTRCAQLQGTRPWGVLRDPIQGTPEGIPAREQCEQHALSRALGLAGWEGGKKGGAQRGMGAASVQAWRTRMEGSRSGEGSTKSPGPAPRTPELEAAGQCGGSWPRRDPAGAAGVARWPGAGPEGQECAEA